MSRPLTETEAALIERVIARLPESARQGLNAQIPTTRVVSGSPTFPHLDAGASPRVIDLADGPLPVRAYVLGDDGQFAGELIVWVKGGGLSALEFAWVTDEPPTELPQLAQLTFEDPV